MGVVSSIGIGLKEFWNNAVAGKNGVGPITSVDTENLPVRFAAEVKGFNPEDYMDRKEARRRDRYVQLASAASRMAVEDSGLVSGSFDPQRTGVIIASGIGGMSTFESNCQACYTKGPRYVSPLFIPMMVSNMASGVVAIEHGFKGPSFGVVSACASSTHAIGLAADLIKMGKADIIMAGGSEAAITPVAIGGFASMKALSTRNDEPEKASRPFDKERDGFIIGEGAASLTLESYAHAKARGAHIYAVLAGSGCSADAHHITAPEPEGRGAEAAMKMAIADAGLKPEDIDYINAHGTSTPLGDVAEVKAIKAVFGGHAAKLAVTSSKSMFAHCLGAAGALETVISAMSVSQGIVTPTINYEFPDPACDLDIVPNVARKQNLRAALNNSFGFGGQNAVVVLTKYEEQ